MANSTKCVCLKYKIVRKPAILYGSECWSLNTKRTNKFKKIEMISWYRCRLEIIYIGYNYRLGIIRIVVTSKSLRVALIIGKMRANKFRWFGHIERRKKNEIAKRVKGI